MKTHSPRNIFTEVFFGLAQILFFFSNEKETTKNLPGRRRLYLRPIITQLLSFLPKSQSCRLPIPDSRAVDGCAKTMSGRP